MANLCVMVIVQIEVRIAAISVCLRGGVQLPDSLVDEAVSQADGAGTVVLVPSPRGQEAEQEGWRASLTIMAPFG